jgi:hypothetical protein
LAIKFDGPILWTEARSLKSKGEQNPARHNYGELTPALVSFEVIKRRMVGSLDGGAHYRHHLISTNVRFNPTQKAMLRRSEGPQSALHVEMCMAQHLLPSALGVE